MADEIDVANDNIERDTEIARRLAADYRPEAAHTGFCLSCSEPLEAPRRFCDGDCRDGWERDRRIIRRR